MRDRRRYGRLRRLALPGVLCFGVAVAAVVFLPAALSAPPESKVTICHRTASESNPYTSSSVSAANNGDLQGGHLDHKGPVFPETGPDGKWGDIIPPYTYVDQNGQTQAFPGYNWSDEGQAVYQNGCNPAPAPQPVLTPTLQCIEVEPGGGFLAHFGYDNPSGKVVDSPSENSFSPPPEDRGQPTSFAPGSVQDAFQADSGGGSLTWDLTGNEVTATSASKPCQASITVVKKLNPSSDKGRFALQIDGKTAGGANAVGDGGTTGTIALDSGRRTVGEAAAPGTNLADYDIQLVCRDGDEIVAQGTTPKVAVTVPSGASVVCVVTNTRREGNATVLHPVVECVAFNGATPAVAYWGYRNDHPYPLELAVGPANHFSPTPADRGQPTTFEPGGVKGAFATAFGSASTLVWTLQGTSATASSSSPRCTATVEVRKVTVPANDPGVFNLRLQGHVVVTGPSGTTTGPVTFGVGEVAASETAGPGTNLADYTSAVECTRNGKVTVSTPGTTVEGTVANGDVVVCTFTNTRTNPGPEPPNPPQPTPPPPSPPTPDPPPPGPPIDLAVTKTVSPHTVLVGRKLTWTITITNKSTVAATNVNAIRADESSHHSRILSLTPSQGTCGPSACSLGALAPGASATITAVTRATRVGVMVDIVRIGSEQRESTYLNNTDAAVARAIARKRPSVPVRFATQCRTLTAAPRLLGADSTSLVLATARNLFGRPLRGVSVVLVGPRLKQRAVTDAKGVARFTVTPNERGLILLGGAPRSTASVRSCRTLLAVLAARQPSVTG